ncbi:hypothetical protein [Bauldia sp.]|uniref:hypothetical protein n=1 Tax=Bauldia sp. TaxID=2575872 RepID=UPI003BAA7DE9
MTKLFSIPKHGFVRRLGLAALIVGAGACLSASADEAVPNLEGIWIKADGQVRYWDGAINVFPQDYAIGQIEISGQVGAVFEAHQLSVAIGGAQEGRHGSEPITDQRLPLVGVVGWDGTSVVLSDIGDTTHYQCTLVAENTMHCMLWESGEHALAGRVILERR